MDGHRNNDRKKSFNPITMIYIGASVGFVWIRQSNSEVNLRYQLFKKNE